MLGLIQHLYDCADKGYRVTISGIPHNHTSSVVITVTHEEHTMSKTITRNEWDILEPFSVVDIINKLIEQLKNKEEE